MPNSNTPPARGDAGGFIGNLTTLLEQLERLADKGAELNRSGGTASSGFRVGTTGMRRPTPSAGASSVPPVAAEPPPSEDDTGADPYAEVGGLGPQLARIRELIELPLRYPEAFAQLGIRAPKGVLLHGPPGCGKTLIARSIARAAKARFFVISGPEIIHKFYGESEAHLRKIFDEAARQEPSIVFIDEIDAIAPRRDKAAGDVERRVVAQLLALMDGLNDRGRVIVLAATNLPNALDSALRRPGRFDREIQIPVPDAAGRREILAISTRGMPLAGDVDLDHIAASTHGYVGADVAALCREAAMTCLRDTLASAASPEAALAGGLKVGRAHFLAAQREIDPSALREVRVERPTVRWTDIGGLDSAKRLLRECVEWPLRHGSVLREAGVRAPKGVILCGPPGCGKTLLAKALACESGVNLISVPAATLLSKYVGESEAALRQVFRTARQAAPSLLFFDEADALFGRRSEGDTDSPVTERVLLQFLAELDGVEELRGVLVLAATNRLDRIDPAALRPGRFDHIVELPEPDEAARREIFEVHLRGRPLGPGVDPADLARRTQGFSGARIAHACDEAARAAARRVIAASESAGAAAPQGTVRIFPGDLDQVLQRERDQRG